MKNNNVKGFLGEGSSSDFVANLGGNGMGVRGKISNARVEKKRTLNARGSLVAEGGDIKKRKLEGKDINKVLKGFRENEEFEELSEDVKELVKSSRDVQRQLVDLFKSRDEVVYGFIIGNTEVFLTYGEYGIDEVFGKRISDMLLNGDDEGDTEEVHEEQKFVKPVDRKRKRGGEELSKFKDELVTLECMLSQNLLDDEGVLEYFKNTLLPRMRESKDVAKYVEELMSGNDLGVDLFAVLVDGVVKCTKKDEFLSIKDILPSAEELDDDEERYEAIEGLLDVLKNQPEEGSTFDNYDFMTHGTGLSLNPGELKQEEEGKRIVVKELGMENLVNLVKRSYEEKNVRTESLYLLNTIRGAIGENAKDLVEGRAKLGKEFGETVVPYLVDQAQLQDFDKEYALKVRRNALVILGQLMICDLLPKDCVVPEVFGKGLRKLQDSIYVLRVILGIEQVNAEAKKESEKRLFRVLGVLFQFLGKIYDEKSYSSMYIRELGAIEELLRQIGVVLFESKLTCKNISFLVRQSKTKNKTHVKVIKEVMKLRESGKGEVEMSEGLKKLMNGSKWGKRLSGVLGFDIELEKKEKQEPVKKVSEVILNKIDFYNRGESDDGDDGIVSYGWLIDQGNKISAEDLKEYANQIEFQSYILSNGENFEVKSFLAQNIDKFLNASDYGINKSFAEKAVDMYYSTM